MSDWDDLEPVTPWISNEDAERLLSGTFHVDGTDDLADLNAVLGALRGAADPGELVGLQAALVAFGAAGVTTHDPSTARTRPMMKKLLTGKALAAIGVITLASAGAAAAAGVVPTPFSAPRPSVATSSEHAADEASDEAAADTTTTTIDEIDDAPIAVDAAKSAADVAETTSSTDGRGPDVNGPAKFGLCTAYAARTKHDATTTTAAAPAPAAQPAPQTADAALPVPFQSLSDAAVAAGQSVADFCADAMPGGSADAPGKSGDNPSVTAPGRSGDSPAVTAPGKSADSPSATAPGKSDTGPSATAADNSGGASGNGGTHSPPTHTHP